MKHELKEEKSSTYPLPKRNVSFFGLLPKWQIVRFPKHCLEPDKDQADRAFEGECRNGTTPQPIADESWLGSAALGQQPRSLLNLGQRRGHAWRPSGPGVDHNV
jgi:hypothetical protein